MKKFIIILIAMLALCSCKPNKTILDKEILGNKFVLEQHDYIMFYYRADAFTLVPIGVDHDPECWCNVDYD